MKDNCILHLRSARGMASCNRSVRPLKEVARQQENRDETPFPFTSPYQRTTLPVWSLFQRERVLFTFRHQAHGCPTVIHRGRLQAVCLGKGLSLVFPFAKSLMTSGKRFMGVLYGTLSAASLQGTLANPEIEGSAALTEQDMLNVSTKYPVTRGDMKACADNGTRFLIG